jgi:hypothetical protein
MQHVRRTSYNTHATTKRNINTSCKQDKSIRQRSNNQAHQMAQIKQLLDVFPGHGCVDRTVLRSSERSCKLSADDARAAKCTHCFWLLAQLNSCMVMHGRPVALNSLTGVHPLLAVYQTARCCIHTHQQVLLRTA